MIVITKKLEIDPNSIQVGSKVDMKFHARSISGPKNVKVEYSLPEDSPIAFFIDSESIKIFTKSDCLSTFEKAIVAQVDLVSSGEDYSFPAIVTITVTVKPIEGPGFPDQKTEDKVLINGLPKITKDDLDNVHSDTPNV